MDNIIKKGDDIVCSILRDIILNAVKMISLLQ